MANFWLLVPMIHTLGYAMHLAIYTLQKVCRRYQWFNFTFEMQAEFFGGEGASFCN
jgi:hypothetical protein